ncbi:IclR family transcriptional regulator [Sphingobium fuliginis]|uniref:Transcriptional regulator, IclR family n=1 Tax=Sphingobium fuliginis (strain ATCC 27551) TaxID=336203 RepID=A0A292ZFC6_SPHSA|nr:IclR family transcriptional regulator [Sphingobium fuliginis]GAY22177.1 transcriptional regulator, IclR family [Sphingobium fuliginis]
MRRRVRAEPQVDLGDDLGSDEQGNRQFITALARGLDVVRCFRRGEPPLSNQEIARRTGLPRPTISRIMYTLRDLGYLRYYPKTRSYGLGGAAYVLGHIADENFDPIGAVRPIMQRYAQATGTNIGLSTRERLNMIYVEACEGASLVGLQLRVGDAISLTKSAIGLAYLAGIDERERITLFRQLKRESSVDVDALLTDVREAQEQIAKYGFCMSTGKWRSEIHGITVPVSASKLDGLYVLSSGGPAYLLPERKLREETGPQLLRAARELQEAVGMRPFVPRTS